MPDKPTISVTGIGTASGSPDQLKLHLSLNHMAETAADALVGTAEAATNAIAALDGVRIEQCEVRTVGLSVQDFFDPAKQQVTARIGSYQLDVTIRPIDQAGTILEMLSARVGNALQIRGINLTIEDLEPLKSQARRLAIQDAKTKVVEIAEEMGIELGAIVSILDQHGGTLGGIVQTSRVAMPMSASHNVPIEAGSVSASSAVTLTYAIAG